MEKTYRDPNCIIDAHCHIYPEKIAAKAVAGTDRFYDTTAAGLGTVTDLMVMGEEAGIGHFIVQSVATTAKQVRSINEFIAASVASAEAERNSAVPLLWLTVSSLIPEIASMADFTLASQ